MAPCNLLMCTEESIIPYTALCAGPIRIASTFHRCLQLDAVAFRIVEVNGGTASLGAVALRLLPARNTVRGEMARDRPGIERLDPQAQVIEIGAAGAGRPLGRPLLVQIGRAHV